MKRLALLLALLAAPAIAADWPDGSGDWDYKGAGRYPWYGGDPNERYGYGVRSLTFYEDCGSYTDPTPSDSYPGCLCASSHANFDSIGCWDILPPETPGTKDVTGYNSITIPTQVVDFFDPSGDAAADCTSGAPPTPYACCTGVGTGTDCSVFHDRLQYEELKIRDECTAPGVPFPCCSTWPHAGCNYDAQDQIGFTIYDQSSGEYLLNCAHDWYNTGRADHDTLCWGDMDNLGATAEGAWNLNSDATSESFWDPCTSAGQPYACCTAEDLGTCEDEDNWEVQVAADADRTGWYTGTIPQDWANANLAASGSKMCFTGMYRSSGDTSAGPTIYAFPCAWPSDDPTPKWGPHITSTPLLTYPKRSPLCASGDDADCSTPTYLGAESPHTSCRDAVWVDVAADVVAFACTRSGNIWWYGSKQPYVACNIHRNNFAFNLWNSPTYQLATALTGPSETEIVIDDTIPAGTVPDGSRDWDNVEIRLDSGSTRSQNYSGFSGDTFTIASRSYEDPFDAAIGADVEIQCVITNAAWGNDQLNGFAKFGPDIPLNYWDRCTADKGYHSGSASSPWKDFEIVFYSADDLADVASGAVGPGDITPINAINNPSWMWGECGMLYSIAWDGTNLYVTEDWGAPERRLIHVLEYTGEGEPPPTEEGTAIGTSISGGGIGN